MNGAEPSHVPLRAILALFFLTLAVTVVAAPLSRAKFNFAPEVVRLHHGLTRHTYLEVAAGSRDLASIHYSFLADHLRLIAQAHQPRLEVMAAGQPDNWPIVFSGIYRHIPPSKSGDSDPSAWLS
jgi:hypothetical protein